MGDERSYTIRQLQKRVRDELKEAESPASLARKYHLSSAHFHNILNGLDSPTLRKAMNAPKRLPRIRLSIDVPNRDIIEAYDRARGSMTRAEYLQHLMQQGMQ